MFAVNFSTQPVDRNLKCKIITRYMDGVKVIGYGLIDNLGNHHVMAKDTVEQIALTKQIVNCTAQRYRDTIVMKGINCKLIDLPVIEVSSGKIRGEDDNNKKKIMKNQITLIGRITKGKTTVGYVVKTTNGEEKKLSRNKVLVLARQGKISNARAQLYGERLILRGVGFELTQLPVLKTI